MKTIRTILGTLAVIVLGYGLLAVISFRSNSAFLQRTLYQIFSQSYFVALVLGVAFLLIAIILTVALMSFRDEEREEREEEEEDEPNFSVEMTDADEPEPLSRTELGSFRRPSRPQSQREKSPEPLPDETLEEEDVPQFLRNSLNTRPRMKERPEQDTPSVEAIFGDPDDEQAPPVKKKEGKRCVFCNATIEDGSKICPSCGKRL